MIMNAVWFYLQTFVKLTNQNTNQEIVFVAQTESSGGYKFDLVCIDY